MILKGIFKLGKPHQKAELEHFYNILQVKFKSHEKMLANDCISNAASRVELCKNHVTDVANTGSTFTYGLSTSDASLVHHMPVLTLLAHTTCLFNFFSVEKRPITWLHFALQYF